MPSASSTDLYFKEKMQQFFVHYRQKRLSLLTRSIKCGNRCFMKRNISVIIVRQIKNPKEKCLGFGVITKGIVFS